MGGRVKHEGAQKSLQKHRYCQLCLRNECKWCHVCVCSPFHVQEKTFKVCKLV